MKEKVTKKRSNVSRNYSKIMALNQTVKKRAKNNSTQPNLMVLKWSIAVERTKRCCLRVILSLSHFSEPFLWSVFTVYCFHFCCLRASGRKSISKITIAFSSGACNAHTILIVGRLAQRKAILEFSHPLQQLFRSQFLLWPLPLPLTFSMNFHSLLCDRHENKKVEIARDFLATYAMSTTYLHYTEFVR